MHLHACSTAVGKEKGEFTHCFPFETLTGFLPFQPVLTCNQLHQPQANPYKTNTANPSVLRPSPPYDKVPETELWATGAVNTHRARTGVFNRPRRPGIMSLPHQEPCLPAYLLQERGWGLLETGRHALLPVKKGGTDPGILECLLTLTPRQ